MSSTESSGRRFVLPGTLLLVVLVAIGVTTWAVVGSHRSDTRAEQATLTAVQVKRDAEAVTASRAATEKAAAEKTAAAAREKAKVDAAVKKALADKALADKKKARPAPKIIYRDDDFSYGGRRYGEFGLTSLARPGPIHVYVSPSDTSDKLYPVYAYETVTVYCSVHGQPINGHDYWDWTGDGWIWDKMVDMNGHSPPPCD
jgi:hypothetical protein